MTGVKTIIPSALLSAVDSRSGRVTLVLGAGCSLERPTGLKLSRDYANEIHAKLIDDGVIDEGDCTDPDDLSNLASTVFSKHNAQFAVVESLPRNDFKYAKANPGHLLAAAMMCEGVINVVATLNYDLAMSAALTELGVRDVDEIAGPSETRYLGSKALIYLHRNVNEADLERWILRTEALAEEWKDDWQSVVANRIVAAPVLVFAGLGSPIAVLEETVKRVAASLPSDTPQVFLADPAGSSLFSEALKVSPDRHIRAGWGDFMLALANRLVRRFQGDLVAQCQQLCELNGWDDSTESIDAICSEFVSVGLLAIGRTRARWASSIASYDCDSDNSRPLVADLLLALGVVASMTGVMPSLQTCGVVRFESAGQLNFTVQPITGSGHKRWSQMDVLLELGREVGSPVPDYVLAGGFSGPRPSVWGPPTDIVDGEPSSDLASGYAPPQIVSIDEVRDDSSWPPTSRF